MLDYQILSKGDSLKRFKVYRYWLQLIFLLLFVTILFLNEQTSIAFLQAKVGQPYFVEETHALMVDLLPVVFGTPFWLFWIPVSFVVIGLAFPFKYRIPLLTILGLSYIILLIANELTFHFFTTVITSKSFAGAHQLGDVTGSVWTALSSRHLFRIGSFLLVFLFGSWVCYRLPVREKKHRAYDLLLFSLLLVFCSYSFSVVQKAQTLKGPEKNQKTFLIPGFKSSQADFAITFGFGNLLVDDLYDRWTKKPSKALTQKETHFVGGVLEERYTKNKLGSPFWGVAKGRNVFFISLESFQTFIVNLHLEENEIVPNFNKYLKESVYFEYIFDNITLGGSSDAEYMLMTGLLSDSVSLSIFEHPGRLDLLYLPQTLKSAGYHCYSFHGNYGDFYNRATNHPTFGFERSFFLPDFRKEFFQMGVKDAVFFEDAVNHLKSLPQPFFSYLISISSHHPFRSPPETADLETGYESGSELCSYFQAVHYTDRAFGNFMKNLKKAKLFENSIFFIFGDHAAPISEESRSAFEMKHGVHPGKPWQLRVPLLIFMPGVDLPNADDYKYTFGGLQDFFPTVLHLIGEPVPFGLYGVNLFLEPEKKGVELNWRAHDGFGYEGRLYSCPAPDKCPVLWSFTENYPPLEDKEAVVKGVISKDYYFLHRFLYEKNAQRQVRDIRHIGVEN